MAPAAACGSNSGRPAGPFEPCVMPAGESYAGRYHSDWGEMRLTQTGSALMGTWENPATYKSGRLEGTVQGCLAYFSWFQTDSRVPGRPVTTNGRGVFRYVVPPAGTLDQTRTLDGVWGYGTDQEGGGTWTGRKWRRD